MPIIYEDFDAGALLRSLNAAREHLVDKDLMTSIGLSLLNRNQDRHIKEVDPNDKPWTELKPATIKRKTNPRMLVEHGDMLRFYSHPTKGSVTVGTADKKAYWHHAGTKHGLPARPIIGFPASDAKHVERLIDDHLKIVLRSLT